MRALSVAETIVMGGWYLGLSVSLLLILIGLYTHWTVILLGAVLPFIPLLSFLRNRNRNRPDSHDEH